MRKTDFNSGWTCRALGKSGKEGEKVPVTLPHDAMRTEKRIPTSLGEANIGWFEGLDYEYEKHFRIPEEERGRELVLEFESVYHNAEVFVNGKPAMSRPYGYTNFYVPLNGFIDPNGENEIRVKACNSDQPNSRWYSGTGIYRPVWLYSMPEQHILMNGICVRTESVDPVRARVTVRTNAAGTVRVEVCGEEGQIGEAASEAGPAAGEENVFTASFDLALPKAKLWSVDEPNLYTVRVSFGEDGEEVRTGFRTLAWNPRQGIALNGKRVVIRGGCIHHDNGLLGACTYPEVERRRIRILKEAGYNAVRSAHNPASKYLLDACDELGMLMMDEYVDCWFMHKTEHDYASYVENWWKQDLKDLVEKDRNRPSVIMYSTGNEVAETARERGVRLQQSFTDYLHELDDTRPVTCGINIFFNFLSSMGLGVYSDEKAKKQAEAAQKAASAQAAKKPKKKHVGSEFYNVLAAKLGCDFMKFGASLPPCDWKTKDAFAAMDIAGYNYGNWRYRKDARKYKNRLILGSETLIGDAYDFWEVAKDVPQVVGDFVWAAWDYIGECGPGGPEFDDYRSEKPEDSIRGGTCRIDPTGKMTPEVDYTKVAFELEKGPFIAVFPVYEKTKPEISGWQLTRAVRSWTWPGCDGETAEIEVYARAAKVELFVNGKSAASAVPKKGIARLKILYTPGTLEAKAYDAAGNLIGTDCLKTAGEETKLVLEPETMSAAPGEMVYFRIRYTDGEGIVKPMEKHRVSVSAENAAVMGFANGSVYFSGNYAQSEGPTYFGEAQTVVQAPAEGAFTVRVSDGERSAEATISCRG